MCTASLSLLVLERRVAMNMASPALMAEYTGCGGEVHVWVRVGEKLPSYMVGVTANRA